MKLITRDTDYAIRALCFVAKQKRRIYSVGELAGKLKIPKPFLRKILQILNKKGLIVSYKGKGGGFMLDLAPNNISVIDLIEIFQGPAKLSEHTFKKKPCPHSKSCKLKEKIDDLERYLMSELRSLTVFSLL
ncbi:MAG: hypothetical protein A2Z72_07785 [Omnitrophica bacterium RBG_13_46_9]|nr:MAG: hypothetical protein A2Z72_07785 [Omnitrophica bacterium RBG_13_46_9]